VNAPLFSIVTPVYNPPPAILERMLESVRGQTFEDWELCLVDDAAEHSEAWPQLERVAAEDTRIRIQRSRRRAGIVAASNAALEMATGRYVALLDHDDELAANALEAVAAVIAADPELDFLYSDEDKIEVDGFQWAPMIKPGWSPDRLLGHMYTGHLSVYRRALMREVGGFREGFDGAQDWDLALRVSERTSRIERVPQVLYHWRTLLDSAASRPDAKPWAHVISRRVVNEHLRRRRIQAVAEAVPGYPGHYWLRPALEEEPLVSVVIPTAGTEGLIDGVERPLVLNAVRTLLERSTYQHLEFVVVADAGFPEPLRDGLTDLAGRRVKIVDYEAPFNFSAKINLGVRASNGEYLLLLNDDIEPLPEGFQRRTGPQLAPLPEWPLAEPGGRRAWIESMLVFARQATVGAVGAKLYFPDGTLQHAGVIAKDGAAGHAYYATPGDNTGYAASLLVACNYLGVTAACLMTRRSAFDAAGGFSEDLPVNYNDVDFCLKLRERGQRSVFVPWVELLHRESSTRGPSTGSHAEIAALQATWGDVLFDDPFYDRRFADGNYRLIVG
jgi:O-antigen biosynthesis protein